VVGQTDINRIFGQNNAVMFRKYDLKCTISAISCTSASFPRPAWNFAPINFDLLSFKYLATLSD